MFTRGTIGFDTLPYLDLNILFKDEQFGTECRLSVNGPPVDVVTNSGNGSPKVEYKLKISWASLS
jgi:hypothetical protein